MRSVLFWVVLTTACGGSRPAPSEPTGDRLQPRQPSRQPQLDPNACGDYAQRLDDGRKLKLFLQAVVDLERTSRDLAVAVRASCIAMGHELGMTDDRLELQDLCAAVHDKLRDGLKLSFRTATTVNLAVTPAACQVDAAAHARTAARCEGAAAVSAQCRAVASVSTSIAAACTAPAVTVDADPKHVLDTYRANQVVAALRAGLPKLLAARARLAPTTGAVTEMVAVMTEIRTGAPPLVNKFKDQALCLAAQIAAATSVMRRVEMDAPRTVTAADAIAGVVRTSP